MTRFLLSVALALSLTATPTALLAQCLPDSVLCAYNGVGTPTVTNAPGQSCVGDWDASQVCLGSCYDLRQGQLAVESGGTLVSWLNQVSAADTYQLLGQASDTPVAFWARMRIQGSLSGSAKGWAFVRNESLPPVRHDYAGGVLNDTLVVALLVRPGDSFVLRSGLAAEGPEYQSAIFRSLLQFVGLPGGFSVTSCQGYEVPVPTQVGTWGKVRALYR